MNDTWGIPSDVFWKLYVLTALGLLVVAVACRIILRPEPEAQSAYQLTPPEMGMLAGGSSRAIAASLAVLRTAGAITVTGEIHGTLPVNDPTFDRFTRAVYAKLVLTRVFGARRNLGDLLGSETSALRQSLTDRGYFTPATWSRTLTLNTVPLIVLGMIGVVRLAFGVAGGKPVVFLLVAVIGIAIAVSLLRVSDGRTRAARTAVLDSTIAHSYLAPSAKPAFAAYGPRLAGVSAALFAGSALLMIDPALASAAGITADGGGSSGDGGGGSGCGGGGCGGGGGGCGG